MAERKQDEKVNLNTASKEELAQIQGIGEDGAEEIIRYRKENGEFRSVNELENIPGLAEMSDDIKRRVTV